MRPEIRQILLTMVLPLFLIFILYMIKVLEIGMDWDFISLGVYLERELKENADKMDLGEIHNGYRLRIIRPEPTLEQIARYEVMKKKVDAAAEKMVRLIAPHLEEQERFQKGMVQGKKVCGSQIYRRDGRILGAGIFRATRTRRWGY